MSNFVIVPDSSVTILGRKDATNLNLLRIGPPPENTISAIAQGTNEESQKKLDNLLERYDHLFHGLGKLKDVEVKIHVDETITPVAQKARRLSILLQEQVDAEIDHLIKLGVLEQVTNPPTWINPLVIVPQKKKKV